MVTDQAPLVANARRVVRILHTALLSGLLLCGAILYLVRRLQPPSVGGLPIVNLVFALVSVALLVIALGAVRPKVPDRRSEQDSAAYWSDAGSLGIALVLWSMIEGAGLVGAVGHFLTGGIAPAVAFALALATLAMLGPGRLEGDGAA